MNAMLFLLPLALALGFAGLLAFLWALRSGQFEDPDGDGARLLFDDDRPARRGGEEGRGR
ncbi:MAG: cbb3-type cytochrome oxidase assembly protein CcoS [Rhodospirillales bacterium]|nr:cbb3-type cytochrome oxidase assembly protein CcoS [Rhodospirillales bacterium]QQS13017.1 MAG: cbb3-type cytochrome oxidase assembly protein CcoS [Rhodospirillales bacterium]